MVLGVMLSCVHNGKLTSPFFLLHWNVIFVTVFDLVSKQQPGDNSLGNLSTISLFWLYQHYTYRSLLCSPEISIVVIQTSPLTQTTYYTMNLLCFHQTEDRRCHNSTRLDWGTLLCIGLSSNQRKSWIPEYMHIKARCKYVVCDCNVSFVIVFVSSVILMVCWMLNCMYPCI